MNRLIKPLLICLTVICMADNSWAGGQVLCAFEQTPSYALRQLNLKLQALPPSAQVSAPTIVRVDNKGFVGHHSICVTVTTDSDNRR